MTRHILLTGAPGIGKTTLVKRIVDKLHLSELDFDFDGFYTEEVRKNRRRTGFDVVSLDGQRAVLARRRSLDKRPAKQQSSGLQTFEQQVAGEQTGEQQTSTQQRDMPTVGPYEVHLEEFENIALPALEKCKSLLIIDEIGKMEMFSKKFQESIKKVIGSKDMYILATVPMKGGPDLVEQLKQSEDCELINVNEINRDFLVEEIVDMIRK